MILIVREKSLRAKMTGKPVGDGDIKAMYTSIENEKARYLYSCRYGANKYYLTIVDMIQFKGGNVVKLSR